MMKIGKQAKIQIIVIAILILFLFIYGGIKLYTHIHNENVAKAKALHIQTEEINSVETFMIPLFSKEKIAREQGHIALATKIENELYAGQREITRISNQAS